MLPTGKETKLLMFGITWLLKAVDINVQDGDSVPGFEDFDCVGDTRSCRP
jgi:hypothetical protein